MDKLSAKQVDAVYEWMMSYSMLNKGAIPLRFKEEFMDKGLGKKYPIKTRRNIISSYENLISAYEKHIECQDKIIKNLKSQIALFK